MECRRRTHESCKRLKCESPSLVFTVLGFLIFCWGNRGCVHKKEIDDKSVKP